MNDNLKNLCDQILNNMGKNLGLLSQKNNSDGDSSVNSDMRNSHNIDAFL